MAQARTWMFTSFNTTHWYNLLTDWKTKGMDSRLRYLVAQLEICPTSGRRHFQGYVELHTGTRITTLKNLFQDNAAHFEQRRGTRDQARDYCMKTDTRDPENISFELGQFKGRQGKRSDWDNIKEMISNGATYSELLVEYPGVVSRCKGTIYELMMVLNPDALRKKQKTHLYVLCGETDTGKSTMARRMTTDLFPDEAPAFYTLGLVSGNNIWFDGYDPVKHRRIIIDSFDSHIPMRFFHNLFQEQDVRVKYKGGLIPFVADEIVITSNLHPKEWYPDIRDPIERAAFYRLIHGAFWFKVVNRRVVIEEIVLLSSTPQKSHSDDEDDPPEAGVRPSNSVPKLVVVQSEHPSD